MKSAADDRAFDKIIVTWEYDKINLSFIVKREKPGEKSVGFLHPRIELCAASHMT